MQRNDSLTRHLDYLDFELEIGPGKGGQYPVSVIRSPAGEARETMQFPFDESALENCLKDLQIALLRSGRKHRRILSPEEKAVQGFGQALFDALITREVRSRYDVCQAQSVEMGKGLRLKLRIQSPELARLPWEFIYDSRQAEYVCLSRNTPVVRYLELPQPIQSLTVSPPLHILGMIASPRDLTSLDIVSEKQRVEEAIGNLRTHGLVDLTWLAGQTWRDLQYAMRRGPWHIFHFIGHGEFDRNTDEGLIALADEKGRVYNLYATHLGRLLADHRPMRLVLLNSCEGARGDRQDIFSSTAASLVRRGIPAVLAMQYEITDQAAIEFARAFYEALTDGMPVDAAVTEARKAISLAVVNSLEWGTPVLFTRAPDGVLFNLTRKLVVPQDQPVTLNEKSVLTLRHGPTARSSSDVLIITFPIDLELIRIPAGEFIMGSNLKHNVSEFYIGKYPVTNAQYAAFVNVIGHRAPCHFRGGTVPPGKENHPVVNISWDDAVAFCRWLSHATGKLVRLPTEAEWEKAARGTDGRIYPWGGKSPDENLCNFGSKVGQTTSVGQYSLYGHSPYGCADMAGNVWEWTQSLYKNYPYNQTDGREDIEAKGIRVLRGGSFYSEAKLVRCAYRAWHSSKDSSDDIGFRVIIAQNVTTK